MSRTACFGSRELKTHCKVLKVKVVGQGQKSMSSAQEPGNAVMRSV